MSNNGNGGRLDRVIRAAVDLNRTGISNALQAFDLMRVRRPQPVDMLLDLNTAHDCLHLLDGRKAAYLSFIRNNLPETPERFACHPQVLSVQTLSSGHHYWDLEVQRSDSWRVGVCYPSIDRKGKISSKVGNDDASWCLSRDGDRYSVFHDRQEIHLFGRISSDTVRIFLDYRSGRISFYEMGDSFRHLHTFTATFTKPLHAVLGVWRGCVKISGRGRNNWGVPEM